jgi:hypothetical protein
MAGPGKPATRSSPSSRGPVGLGSLPLVRHESLAHDLGHGYPSVELPGI